MTDPVARLGARVKAIATIAQRLDATAGLTEADRMALRVATEFLAEAQRVLSSRPKLSASQAAHLEQAGKVLVQADETLPVNPTPAQIGAWARELEPPVRGFVRAVHDLPHR